MSIQITKLVIPVRSSLLLLLLLCLFVRTNFTFLWTDSILTMFDRIKLGQKLNPNRLGGNRSHG